MDPTMPTMLSEPRVYSGFLRSSERWASRPAVEIDDRQLTYVQLREMAETIAMTLLTYDAKSDPPLTAIFAHRSVVCFTGVLGALLRGHGYVPLNPTFPPARTRLMLARAGCKALVVDQASAAHLDHLLAGVNRSLILLLPEVDDVSRLAARWPQHRVLGLRDMVRCAAGRLPIPAPATSIAYLLFTSGSTGTPKGVMVTQRNVLRYLESVVPRYKLTEEDRCSQTFDVTFDLSVHDMFVTWEAGACLCCPTRKELIKPGEFISGS